MAMAGGPHDNFNLVQFRLDPEQLARVDAQLVAEAQTTGKLVSRNSFCKKLFCEALRSLLPAATEAPVPAE